MLLSCPNSGYKRLCFASVEIAAYKTPRSIQNLHTSVYMLSMWRPRLQGSPEMHHKSNMLNLHWLFRVSGPFSAIHPCKCLPSHFTHSPNRSSALGEHNATPVLSQLLPTSATGRQKQHASALVQARRAVSMHITSPGTCLYSWENVEKYLWPPNIYLLIGGFQCCCSVLKLRCS